MRKILQTLILLYCTTTFSADLQPALRIAVPHFTPPYVMQGYKNNVTGFDIVMLTRICDYMRVKCKFVPMSTDDLLQAVADQQADLAVGALAITLAGYQKVNFSMPYLLSNVRFLGLSAQQKWSPTYKNAKIGVTAGGEFPAELTPMANMPKKIISFQHSTQMIDALNKGNIDLALMDNATTIYWQNHSSGKFIAVGKQFSLGFGLGIAVNLDNVALVKAVNAAILKYESTPEFKELYSMYFDSI